MRAVLYLRVSTAEQTTENQERELRVVAGRMGHRSSKSIRTTESPAARDATNVRRSIGYTMMRISGGFDLVMAWSVDRLGRSLQHLVAFLEHLRDCKIDLFLHQQGLDTTTSSGRMMFGMLSVFAEFERAMIRERVTAGMKRAQAKGTKSGKAIGRPRIAPNTRTAIRNTYKVEARACVRSQHNTM